MDRRQGIHRQGNDHPVLEAPQRRTERGRDILLHGILRAPRAIGPALAGIIVAATGEGTAFFLNGLSFLAVIICLLMMRNLPKPAAREEERKTLSIGRFFGDGEKLTAFVMLDPEDLGTP